ncbi:MAG: T9SS type A sorting domain-containing protein [Saprospiraceae bacterium]|nr:T9SS type A sorting domain-containing protein [Candidatus Brachybacter algidus]
MPNPIICKSISTIPVVNLCAPESRVGNAGEQEISLDTNSLAAGIYFVKIVMGDEQVYRKIVIK